MELFESFNSVFEQYLRGSRSREEVFEKAQQAFREKYGWDGYKNHPSFQVARSKRKRR